MSRLASDHLHPHWPSVFIAFFWYFTVLTSRKRCRPAPTRPTRSQWIIGLYRQNNCGLRPSQSSCRVVGRCSLTNQWYSGQSAF